MSLGGLIPIGGAGGGGGKKASSTASDLTGGLISISGQKSGGMGMGDVDMSDFDVDDLLMDTTTATSSSRASKAKASSPKDKKKKSSSSSKSKSKDRDKSSSKKKSKSKRDSFGDDSTDNFDTSETNAADGDWGSASRSKDKAKSNAKSRWDDDSSEFAVPVKKKSSLDAEFAKMLGLEDDFAAADNGDESPTKVLGDEYGNDSDRPSAFSQGFGAKSGGGGAARDTVSELLGDLGESKSDTTSFSYEPRVRGSKARESAGGVSSFSDGGGGGAAGDRRDQHGDPFASSSEKKKAVDDDEKDAVAGLSASFFQSETTGGSRAGRGGDEDSDPFGGTSSLSFLSSTTNERRGGRGGRRGGGERAPVDDPFASSSSGGAGGGGSKSSTFDSLFDSSRKSKLDDIVGSRRRGDQVEDDPFGQTDRERAAPSSDRDGGGGDKQQQQQDELPVARMTISSQRDDLSKAKDDLLSELFPSDPTSSRSRAKKEESSPKETIKQLSPAPLGNAKDDLLAELLPSEPPKPTARASRQKAEDEGESQRQQQDGLLAELFPTNARSEKPSARSVSFTDDDEASETRSPNRRGNGSKQSQEDEPVAQIDKRGANQESKSSSSSTPAASSRKAAGLDDISSARDSLLMDLFPESPPKPLERRRRSNTPSSSPIKEAALQQQQQQQMVSAGKEEAYSPVRIPSLSPQKSPPQVDEQQQQQQSPSRTSNFISVSSSEAQQPQVSPGRAKTLASPSASSIKEVDFEQSKDSLLEELLSPSEPKSPASSPFRGGDTHRRNSYSQSFEDERESSAQEDSSQHRRRMSFAASSPSRSPDKAVLNDSLAMRDSPDAAAITDGSPLGRTELIRTSPVDREKKTAKPMSSPSQERQLQDHISNAQLEEVLDKREKELREEHEAAKAALVATHGGELAKLHAMIAELTQQLHDERCKNQTLATENAQQQAKAKLFEQENQFFLQQIAAVQAEKSQLQQDLHSVQAQHALCATQSALFQSERAGFLNQVKNLEDQNRQLLHQVNQEKQDHQATQLRFASFQQETEQQAQLQKQKESHQMSKLFQQLQTSLVSLKMLQEQVVDEELTKHEVESESRLRMITSLETSSRKCAKQTEEECFRLASLLANLETTLRHYRQEHLEEKERLRQEQLRLSVLATHFQAQTTVMHEKADANTQMLAQYFTSSMQDVRVAESRLAVRRQNLEDEEKQLYDERTRFAVYREEFMQQQAREAQKMQSERLRLDKTWKELQRERDDLDDVIASHDDEFQQLQQQRRELEQGGESIEYRAAQVADMARKFESFTQQLVAREEEIARERQEIDAWKREFASKQQLVNSEKLKLDERELRLHSQLKQIEKSRRRLNDQRKQHLILSTASASQSQSHLSTTNPLAVHDLEQAKQRLMEHTRYMGGMSGGGSNQAAVGVDNNRKWRQTPVETRSASSTYAVDNQVAQDRNWSASQVQRASSKALSFTPDTEPPVWKDPSGLSSSFRQLVEENWKKREWSLDVADAALHKERMWINCIGLDTTPTSGSESTGSGASSHQQLHHQHQHDSASASASKAPVSSTRRNQQQQHPSITTRQTQSTPPPPPPPQSQPLRQPAKRSVTIDL